MWKPSIGSQHNGVTVEYRNKLTILDVFILQFFHCWVEKLFELGFWHTRALQRPRRKAFVGQREKCDRASINKGRQRVLESFDYAPKAILTSSGAAEC